MDVLYSQDNGGSIHRASRLSQDDYNVREEEQKKRLDNKINRKNRTDELATNLVAKAKS